MTEAHIQIHRFNASADVYGSHNSDESRSGGIDSNSHLSTRQRVSASFPGGVHEQATDTVNVVSILLVFVAHAITVIKFVRKIPKVIEDAPELLQALLARAADIERLLDELQLIQLENLFKSKKDQELPDRCDRATTSCIQTMNIEKGLLLAPYHHLW